MDMNGDGQPDYGSCMFKKRNAQSYFAIMSIAAQFVQTAGHRAGHVLQCQGHDADGKQRGLGRSVPVYKDTGEYGPPEERTRHHRYRALVRQVAAP